MNIYIKVICTIRQENTLYLGIDSSSVNKRDGLVFSDIPTLLGKSSLSHKLTSDDCNILFELENEDTY